MPRLSLALTKQVISTLEKINVLRFGDFELKNGSRSSFYIDLRILPNYPAEFQEITNIAADYIRTSENIGFFDGIIAPPLAGIPLGVSLALKLKKKYFLARLERKKHGTQKLIEGNISNKRILLVDDVITSGGSKIPLLNMIRNHGAKVASIFVFINRLPNKELMKKFEQENNVNLSFLLSLKDLLNHKGLLKTRLIF
ncbi:MAG: hypothetical protein JSW11_06725 [Candidatus Heimdallarchaeota archaeon]|nr:MAG: hypothetical protein JSW11_06725 [Candidatus Heimdallarchaeota archaeon]